MWTEDFYCARRYGIWCHAGRAGRAFEGAPPPGVLEIVLDNDLEHRILEKLQSIEDRISALEEAHAGLQSAYGRSRVHVRRALLRPPMWTFEQHSPQPLDLSSLPVAPALPARVPSIAIVTPSYNQARFLGATIDSILRQNYPKLFYHVQDGASETNRLLC